MSRSGEEYDRAMGRPKRPELVPSQYTERYQARHVEPEYGTPQPSIIYRMTEWWERPHPVLGGWIFFVAAAVVGYVLGRWAS